MENATLVDLAIDNHIGAEPLLKLRNTLGNLGPTDRGFRRRFGNYLRKQGYYQDISGGMATIVGSRSGLYWKTVPGGLPVIIDAKNISGNVFFVDVNAANGGTSSGYGTHPDAAITDLDNAQNLCYADQGDTIFVLPGHAESLVADSGVDLDTAGVHVMGLGHGAARPTITFTTDVAADIKLAAASVRVENILFKAGIDALTGPIEISADDCQLVNCEYQDDDTNNYETTDVVVTASTPLRMLIDGLVFNHPGGSGGTQLQSVLQLNGADHAVIRNCKLVADAGTGVIEDATVSDNILIENSLVENTETSPTVGILFQATTNGAMVKVYVRIASGVVAVTAGNDMQFFDCWGVGVDAEAAFPIGVNPYNVGAWPNAAIPADGVSQLEVLRQLYAALEGTAAGQNGVATWPTAAAYGNNVSIAEVLGYVQDQVRPPAGAHIPGMGIKVTKSLNAFGTQDAFTVTGKVLITLMIGEVTTVLGDTQVMSLRMKTNSTPMCADTTIGTDADGTMYMLSGDPGEVLNGADVPGVDVVGISGTGGPNPMVVGNGGGSDTIEFEDVSGAAASGVINWELWYIPLEASASVVAV